MRRARGAMGWLRRPQVLVGLIAMAFCLWPLGQTASSTRVQAPFIPKKATLAAEIQVDCTVIPCVALTFDDGPSAHTTTQILDVLDRYQVHATFFVIGAHVPGHEAELRRMHAAGHEIGNHSFTHPDFTKLSPEDMQQQVAQAQSAVAAAGVPVPHLFRPPYGAINSAVRAHVPLAMIEWNVDPEDWRSTDPAELLEHITTHAKPGAIITLHDTEHITVDTLPAMLDYLTAHYQLVTVSRLLHLTSSDPGVFYGR